jgi:NADPH:quinone reductase-like Zn-dependent oxidoreductase
LGADHCINYIDTPNWGEKVFQLAGKGVDLVLEIGGTGTMENSLAAIRNGGHIAIIGYVAGADMGISVFPLIIKCAHLHGIATGNRENYAAMMNFIEEHSIQPEIGTRYAFKDANKALADLVQGAHFGKLVIDYQL